MKGTIKAVILLICVGLILGFIYSELHPALGESVTVGDVQFTVYNYAINESFLGHYPPPGAKYVVIFVEAKNVGEKARHIPSADDYGFSFSPAIVLKYKGTHVAERFRWKTPRGMYHDKMIYPNIRIAGWLCYEVLKL